MRLGLWRAATSLFKPFHSKVKTDPFSSEIVRIGSIIIFHLSKLWKAMFIILCDNVIFLVRLQVTGRTNSFVLLVLIPPPPEWEHTYICTRCSTRHKPRATFLFLQSRNDWTNGVRTSLLLAPLVWCALCSRLCRQWKTHAGKNKQLT